MNSNKSPTKVNVFIHTPASAQQVIYSSIGMGVYLLEKSCIYVSISSLQRQYGGKIGIVHLAETFLLHPSPCLCSYVHQNDL